MGCRKVFTDRKVRWQIQHEKHLILFSLRLVVSKAENLCLSFCCLVLFSYFVTCIKVTLRPEFRIFFECNFIFVTCLNFYLYFVYLPSSIIL